MRIRPISGIYGNNPGQGGKQEHPMVVQSQAAVSLPEFFLFPEHPSPGDGEPASQRKVFQRDSRLRHIIAHQSPIQDRVGS